MREPRRRTKSTNYKPFLIAGGIIIGLFFVTICSGIIWLASGAEGGVRLPNQMEEYAQKYLDKHHLLNETEELIAYYDVTISLDGTEAAILTNERVIYHSNNQNTFIKLEDISDIQHRTETLLGDIFEITSTSGKRMKFEIAPLNQGQTFKNVLFAEWEKSKQTP